MAYSKKVLLLAAVAAVACLASPASATQWMVGDDAGWRAMFNLIGWANGKTFVVGDSLMFMYPKENHTVAQVGEEDFAACNLQGNQLGFWDSGNDVVQLDKPGKVWFICTKPNHCLNGMKLVVDVVDPNNAAPAPAPLFRFPFPIPGVQAPAPSPLFRFPFPIPGVQAPAPSPLFRFPGVQAPAPSPLFRFPFPIPGVQAPAAPADPAWPPASPPSAAVRYPVGGAVAAAAAAVVAAALAF